MTSQETLHRSSKPRPVLVIALVCIFALFAGLYALDKEGDVADVLERAVRSIQNLQYLPAMEGVRGFFESITGGPTREVASGDYEAARRQFSAKQYEMAIQSLSRVLEKTPDNKEAQLLRARAFFELDNDQAAFRDIDQVLLRHSKYVAARTYRGWFYKTRKNYSKAIEDFTVALDVRNKDGFLDGIESLPFARRGASPNASLDQANYDKWLYVARGESHFMLANYDDAAADITQALRLLDEMPELGRRSDRTALLYLRGRSYAALGNIEQASNDFANGIDTLVNTVAFFRVDMPAQEMVDTYTALIELNGEQSEYFSYRGYAQGELSDSVSAINDLNYAIDLQPTNSIAFFGRALIKDRTTGKDSEKIQSAISDYAKAVSLDPALTLAYRKMGALFHEVKDYVSAGDSFSRYIESHPDHYQVYQNRAWAYAGQGDYSSAIADVKTAILLKPGTGYLEELLEDYQSKLEDDEKSESALGPAMAVDSDLELYSKAIKDDPKSTVAYLNRAEIFEGREDYKSAEADYSSAIQVSADQPLFYSKRAQVRIKLGNVEGAIQDLYSRNDAIGNLRQGKYLTDDWLIENELEFVKNILSSESATETGISIARDYLLATWDEGPRDATNERLPLLKELLARFNQGPVMDPWNYFRIAKEFEQRSDLENSIAALTTALNQIDVNPSHLISKGQILKKRSELAERTEMYDVVIADTSILIQVGYKVPESMSRRAVAYARSGMPGLALKDFESVLANEDSDRRREWASNWIDRINTQIEETSP